MKCNFFGMTLRHNSREYFERKEGEGLYKALARIEGEETVEGVYEQLVP